MNQQLRTQTSATAVAAAASNDPTTRRNNNNGRTNSSSISRTSNYRMIIISVISFLLGLQFSQLTALFQANITVGGFIDDNNEDVTEYMTWAPDEIENEERVIINNHRHREEDKETTTTKQQPRKKRGRRNRKPLPRYHTDNYDIDNFQPLPWSLPRPSPIRYQTSEEFMNDYIALKREKNIPLPWEQTEKYKDDKVTLPRPIIGLNFPKSATLTMSEYFRCAGITAHHTATPDGRIGICMMENHLTDKPPMEGCDTDRTKDDGDVKSLEVIFDIGLQGPPCYYASLHDGGLENIAKHYPEGTIMLVTRNSTKWAKSITGWNGKIMALWAEESCHFDGSSLDGEGMEYWNNLFTSSPGKLSRKKVSYWIEFYEAHTQKIREFAMKHLSLTYVEVELENDKMAEQLEYYTGVTQKCVQVCHPGPHWIRKHDTTSKCHPVGEEPPEIDPDADDDSTT